MRTLSGILFTLLFWGTLSVSAQKSTIYNSNSKDFETAVSLYTAGQYASAKLVFDRIKTNSANQEVLSDCLYYTAMCAIRERQPSAGSLMERFVSDYPTSTKRNQAYVELGHFYFQQENYEKALSWYEKVDEMYLGANESEKYNFQKGYSFFVAKNKKEASIYLNKVLNTPNYGSQAKYYLGFMAYEGDDYKRATQYFDAVATEGKYKERMSYYQSDMNFKQGNFQKAIDLGEQAMAKSTLAEQSELNKIIGESYFNLKEYEKAIQYLKLYKGKNGKWTNVDFYQLGFAYYQQKEFQEAVSQFNKIIDGKDFVAQNGYYHLGQSYLHLDKKQEALNAFKNASEMDFDASLKEESSLNYAKLSYEIGNSYESVPAILMAFLERYPQNSNQSAIEKLLIDSYISSKNYKEALAILEKKGTQENKLAYQKVLFYSGLQSFTDGEYKEALERFEKAIGQQKDALITARATFWKGETQFVLDDFKNALLTFKQFISFAEAINTAEFKNCNYNIAYAYFKMKEYDQAGNYFQKQIEKGTDKVRMNDAYLRLADCRFVTSKYWPAMEAYAKVIEQKGVDADYAFYQRAISYGFVGKNEKKIENLVSFLQLYPKSEYRDDALFELGNTYVTENKDEKAIATYDQLIKEFENGSFVSKSILRQGLVYYNADKDTQAIAKFKQVVAAFPKSAEALEAVSTARLIYVENGKVDEYASWVRTLDFVAVSDADLDNDTYESAEKQYQQSNTSQAITGFGAYLTAFPKGIHALQAHFYLAQSQYSNGSEEKSIPNYEYVIAEPRNEFTEPSLMRLAEIFLKAKEVEKAIVVLSRIETEADLLQNKTFAQANLMKLYYDKKDYANAVVYAEKVLENPKTEADVKSDAQIVVARSAMETGDEAKAKSGYEKLMTAQGELGAEALYYDAYFKNKAGKFEDSNVAIQQLAKNYSDYKYFGAKGLLLMATNFYALKDSYQATYILETIIKNFTDFPEVVAQAQKDLETIKAEESKTNSSITN
ncbi:MULTISPECIES: tetratricopeptide repeat protein [Flavobacterium]|uniref:Tetratricopeptide repeat protein n=1 Tax=Flavobacterium keumense TaxID=1306518 RepID=A0ABY8N4P4_9FLAO|nr:MULTISPECIES: tetratricopeptide repeat protein [Flavobacterium]WGK94622.1 tetratricopeptide repeat protein [Flavobacterium keumense]